MLSFCLRFLICNLFISLIILMILAARLLFTKYLSNRMKYQLWFIMLALLAVPFLPIQVPGFSYIFSFLVNSNASSASDAAAILKSSTNFSSTDSSSWINDFSISISKSTPTAIELLMLGIWLMGILTMIILVAKSGARLYHIKQSALLLQNQTVRKLYQECLEEMGLHKSIPIYSSAFLKSPIMVGLLFPRIYLPIHLISEYNATDLRYMLLHELQHYKHKDTLANYFMNLAGVLYWFNPLVWYALREMRCDREIACDTSVLQMLNDNDYEAYGNTLINFAEKISLSPFPFSTGISGSMKQMTKRIVNIASYEQPTFIKKLQSLLTFFLITLLLIGLSPVLSIYASEESSYQWITKDETIISTDFSSYFKGYHGSFVLYDLENDLWNIYNRDYALMQVSPDSTYKIYDALWGLEAGAITAKQSQIDWNQEIYPFEAWNSDQDLNSAMQNSVNWYFETIDKRIGKETVKNFLKEIKYGNQNMTGTFPTYWLESSLKISPVEQVELLRKLYAGDFGFSPENIQAIKNSLCLSSTAQGTFFGKTGTGRVNNQDVNGWFIGYVQIPGHTYFFSTNIQADSNATGTAASDITLSILSDLGLWK